jgi:outer membrane biosynthesis protein TonB
MIPRTLVPIGARLPAEDVASTRRRPSTLVERTLVPSNLPVVKLDGQSAIPTNLPLDSIATRVVVPRDIDVESVQRPEESSLPAQPTEMDERVTVPQGPGAPLEFSPLPSVSEELIEPDILQTGEVSFLPPEERSIHSREDRITAFTSAVFHGLFLLLLIFSPKIFKPHVRTSEEEDIARRQITVLLPPGALDALRPSPRVAPAPHESVRVDPKILNRISPPIQPPPVPVPQPEPPKRELPSAPTPKPNVSTPAPQTSAPVARVEVPKAPLKLEMPDSPPTPNGLILPKQLSPGDAIRNAERNSGKINSPVPIGSVGQLPSGGGGGGGRGRGSAGAGVQMLTDTEGIDFNDYLHRVYIKVKQNWYAVMPASVYLGDQGVVSLRFKIMKDGSVPDDDPAQVFSSGKEPLDRAAFSSIRGSNPFQPLPAGFKAPYIELQFTYYYNTAVPNQ